MSKALLIDSMVRKSGMQESDARIALECFLECIKKALGKGISVEIEELGVLEVVSRRPSRRRIVKGLKHVSPTACESYKHRKTIRLKRPVDLSPKQ
jgi:nucleoid DNA-binding protein